MPRKSGRIIREFPQECKHEYSFDLDKIFDRSAFLCMLSLASACFAVNGNPQGAFFVVTGRPSYRIVSHFRSFI